MPKKCPACQQNTPEASPKELEARQGFWDEVILKETITEPETWEGGEYDWWEKRRRVAKTYGPGLHIDRATPPPRIRTSNPWDGLFSWLYTPKGPSGQRELVVRYEKNIIHREAWCGERRATPDAPPSNFDLRPNPDEPPAALQLRQEDATCGRFIVCGLGNPEALCGDYRKYPPPSLTDQLQKRQIPPSNGPTKAERELSTDIMIDPEDAIGGEVWWWDRMRNAVDERGAGYGGHPDNPGHWSTSTMVTLDQEIDGTATNRPRFDGSGPIWGCTAIVVASPEAIWTSHIWELPSHARGEAHGRAAFEQWSKIFPRPTVEYYKEEFLDFLDNGNTKGNFRQLYEYKFPGRNPGLKYMFMENGAFNVKEKEFVWVGIVTRSYKNLEMPRVQYDWQIQQVYEKFIAWGVDPENIKVKAYPARLDFTVGGSQIKPHWGILSWQYHPKHREGNHEENKIRIRFEKEILFEKSWCGSGVKIPEPKGKAPMRRRQEDIEVCKMVISSKESALATRVSTTFPEPTQACANDAECGSLSCPENRISACYHAFCQCVILANPNNTEILTGTVYATPTTTLEASQTPRFPISWLLPNVSSTVMSSNTSTTLSKSLMTASMGTSTSTFWLGSSLPSLSSTTFFMGNLTAT
ncbi:hypothetical protein CSPAE12_05273 [Colletotrichum incanum]|nr:hypothetical protein CSPAE12_05273 [Colletotrichum incanum]